MTEAGIKIQNQPENDSFRLSRVNIKIFWFIGSKKLLKYFNFFLELIKLFIN